MKKQTNPNIKAHLIRSAFYVLLLLAVCVIPFALGQRNIGRHAPTLKTSRAGSKAVRPQPPQGTCPFPWSFVASMPLDFYGAAGGYVPGNGKIYIVSGYNTGTVDSAQPNTWEYDPVTDTWNDLTATVPFPHPAGGFAFGVINDKLYISGGRDAANADINFTWEFDPAIPAYTAKADMPGGQPNVRGSAVAVGALFAFGGGNPFLAPENVATRTASAAVPAPGSAKAAPGATGAASALAKTAPARNFDPAAIKRNPLLPTTTGRTDVYDPSTDTWTRSADLEPIRSDRKG